MMTKTPSVTRSKWLGLGIALFILLNLFTSNFLVDRLPENVFRFMLSMWSPAIFAIIFALVLGMPFKSTLGLTKSKWSAYLASIAFPLIIGLSTIVIGLILGYLTRSTGWTIKLSNAIPTFVIWCVASLGEELGWRGFLHASLKPHRHAPLWIGIVWALWHFSQVIAESGWLHAVTVFTPTVILISYFLSSLREYGNSIWPSALFHGVWNFLRLKILFGNPGENTIGLFTSSAYSLTDMEGLFGLISLAIFSVPVVWYWYRNLARPRSETAQDLNA